MRFQRLLAITLGLSVLLGFQVARAARTILPLPPVPILAAAGDIACDPGDSNFKGGVGTGGNCHMEGTADVLARINPSVVAQLGDLQYEDGSAGKFSQSYDKSWGQFKARSRPAPGNHEYGSRGAAGYFSYFGDIAGPSGRGYYSYELGGWRLFALNSNCGAAGGCGADSAQVKWLRADLAAHPTKCALAYWHHPRFSSGPHGDTGGMDAIWKALFEGGADVVLQGHDHLYERFAPLDGNGRPDPARGIRSFVVGTGGKTLYNLGKRRPGSEVGHDQIYGVLSLRLRPDRYDWGFVPELRSLGRFHDTGQGTCH